jgi:hypothetical protein
MGGWAEPVLRRAARIADGWYCGTELSPEIARRVNLVRAEASAADRPPGTFGVEGGIELRHGLDVEHRLGGWRALGATHVTIDPMNRGVHGFDHVKMLSQTSRLVHLAL